MGEVIFFLDPSQRENWEQDLLQEKTRGIFFFPSKKPADVFTLFRANSQLTSIWIFSFSVIHFCSCHSCHQTWQEILSSQCLRDSTVSWTIKKAKCWIIDAFGLWCWRRCLRVPWTARRPNQSILKEINPEDSLEGLMLKLQYFGHLMRRADSLEKTLTVGKIEGRRRRGRQGLDGWMPSPTWWMWVWASSRRWWRTGKRVVLQSMGLERVRLDWATEQQQLIDLLENLLPVRAKRTENKTFPNLLAFCLLFLPSPFSSLPWYSLTISFMPADGQILRVLSTPKSSPQDIYPSHSPSPLHRTLRNLGQIAEFLTENNTAMN